MAEEEPGGPEAAEVDATPAPAKPQPVTYAGPTIDGREAPESARDMVAELMKTYGLEDPAQLIQLAIKNREARDTITTFICDADPEQLANARMNPLSVIISYVNSTTAP